MVLPTIPATTEPTVGVEKFENTYCSVKRSYPFLLKAVHLHYLSLSPSFPSPFPLLSFFFSPCFLLFFLSSSPPFPLLSSSFTRFPPSFTLFSPLFSCYGFFFFILLSFLLLLLFPFLCSSYSYLISYSFSFNWLLFPLNIFSSTTGKSNDGEYIFFYGQAHKTFAINWCLQHIVTVSRVAQWKRAGPITQRSVDRNYALLISILILFYCQFSNLSWY